jgi:hypothetical protein
MLATMVMASDRAEASLSFSSLLPGCSHAGRFVVAAILVSGNPCSFLLSVLAIRASYLTFDLRFLSLVSSLALPTDHFRAATCKLPLQARVNGCSQDRLLRRTCSRLIGQKSDLVEFHVGRRRFQQIPTSMVLSKPMEMMAAATAAGVGGFLSTSILYPLDTLKTRIQSGAALLPEDDEADASSTPKRNKQVALLKSLYQGIQYKAAESSTSKFMYFYAYTMLAQMVAPKDGQPIGTLTDLGIGYLSELCHLPVTMPMELVGTRMQTGSESGSILQILRSIVKEGGVGGLYKGLGAYFVLCLQPAIQYTVFERLKGMYLRRFKQASQALGALEVGCSHCRSDLGWRV